MYHHIQKIRENEETSSAGSKWTEDEEFELLASLALGEDIEHIAKQHKRTVGGIRSRRRVIAVRMVQQDGKEIKEVCSALRMTPEQVTDALNRKAIAGSNKIEKREAKKQMRYVVDLTIDNKMEHVVDLTIDNKMEHVVDLLKDIRDVLLRLESKILTP